MSTEVVHVLEDARARVAKGWCQQAYARDAAGNGVVSGDPLAAEWCMRGAVFAVTARPRDALELLAKAIGVRCDGNTLDMMSWNDSPGRTQAEVLAALDKAIALAREAK